MNAPDSTNPTRMDRRSAIKWMLTAAASVAIIDRAASAAESATPAAGYGTDPDLIKTYKPGDVWALSFNDKQRRAATALCDAIIPADDKSPAASKLGVPDFIDEWISAPYPGHSNDKTTVLDGLAWIDAESQKRYGNDFADLVLRQKNAICDDICSFGKAKPEFKKAAQFFRKFRDLTAGGFYSTPEGMKDIGYVGNVATATFEGPTPEALKHLGLA
ncbi:MAG: gluconate 2-dehydrogenase subunit 3 family protein [Verrucomicrobia bacterium]|nr:gluconate 2-dehydrogenase subunit 3 family protein [Verrucomicrobiota bacterium]